MIPRKHPAYHLRPNKAVDRLAFVKVIDELRSFGKLRDYTYYGFGGPYLEDCRLIHEFYPEMKIVSFEEDAETFKRQQFHRPCSSKKLHLLNKRFDTFLTQYEANGEKSIFWADYIDFELKDLQEFSDLLLKVSENSLVKITLCDDWKTLFNSDEDVQRFKDKFGDFVPEGMAVPGCPGSFAKLIEEMVKITAYKALPGGMETRFQKISSHYYIDGDPVVFTLTGIVCKADRIKEVANVFREADNTNLEWGDVKEINLPALTTKERLHLQSLLPCVGKKTGVKLRTRLGYYTDGTATDEKLRQYAEYYSCFPYFMKATP